MSEYLQNYISRAEQTRPGIGKSIKKTVEAVVDNRIGAFDYQGELRGLIMGEVQSGKTAQVFGVLAAAADLGQRLFVLLTPDNVHLQGQTYRRALSELGDDFNVCDENDQDRFILGGLRKPVLIVLKKNRRVLSTWGNNIGSSGYHRMSPLFLVDDEADTATPNTKINQSEHSAINSQLTFIRGMFNSGVFIQVTATPQALLLQTQDSGLRPVFIHYFPPGRGYLGGRFFYSEPHSFAIRLVPEDDLDHLLDDPGLTRLTEYALQCFLLTAAHLRENDSQEVCNFVIHPSVSTNDHEIVRKKIQGFLDSLTASLSDEGFIDTLRGAWADLQQTKPDLLPLEKLCAALPDLSVKCSVMNSRNEVADYNKGTNIVIGGNSLGRGVTFPALQTVYYCRSTRRPQADTSWQHSRMFGYDRDPNMMRVFLPESLLNLFIELSRSNEMLVQEICNTKIENLHLLYPVAVNPTRKSVVDRKASSIIIGGVNYFPREPRDVNTDALDGYMAQYCDGEHSITCRQGADILQLCGADDLGLWGDTTFADCLTALGTDPSSKVNLVVRRNRNIGKGTGTLLSPSDRALGDSIKDATVLTMYRLEGEKNKGWNGSPLWVPNIKLPEGRNFHVTP